MSIRTPNLFPALSDFPEIGVTSNAGSLLAVTSLHISILQFPQLVGQIPEENSFRVSSYLPSTDTTSFTSSMSLGPGLTTSYWMIVRPGDLLGPLLAGSTIRKEYPASGVVSLFSMRS